MAIMRWDPLDAFLGAQEDLNRLFRRGFLSAAASEDKSLVGGSAWAPAVDIYETADSFTVEVELPGVEPGEIDVSVDDGMLSIKGERSLDKETREENFLRVERASGMFQRSMRLPTDIDADKVKASYDNGVLKITVPKIQPKKAKSVPIAVESKKAESKPIEAEEKK